MAPRTYVDRFAIIAIRCSIGKDFSSRVFVYVLAIGNGPGQNYSLRSFPGPTHDRIYARRGTIVANIAASRRVGGHAVSEFDTICVLALRNHYTSCPETLMHASGVEERFKEHGISVLKDRLFCSEDQLIRQKSAKSKFHTFHFSYQILL